MIKKIKDVLNLNLIYYFSVCGFKTVKDKLIKCRNINLIPENPKSIITAVFPYFYPINNHNISRFAVPKDYHITVYNLLLNSCKSLEKIFPENRFIPFTDNSPIPEVYAAVTSGLGVRGQNGLLITPEFGSWVFIGEIVTDLYIDSVEYEIKPCVSCRRCIKICPSKALSINGFNKNRCISHITQKKRDLSIEEINYIKLGNSIWGCDICQEVCPMNKNKKITYLDIFKTDLYPVINIGDYEILSERAFQWRPKEVIERNLLTKIKK